MYKCSALIIEYCEAGDLFDFVKITVPGNGDAKYSSVQELKSHNTDVGLSLKKIQFCTARQEWRKAFWSNLIIEHCQVLPFGGEQAALYRHGAGSWKGCGAEEPGIKDLAKIISGDVSVAAGHAWCADARFVC